MREDAPGIQVVLVDTCAAEGAGTVTTRAVRLCFPHAGRIVFKETRPPRLLAAHSGEWSLLPDASGVTVVAAHRVMLRQDAVAGELGENTSLLEAHAACARLAVPGRQTGTGPGQVACGEHRPPPAMNRWTQMDR